MRVNISKKNILEIISSLDKVVNKNASLMALRCFLIVAKEDRLYVRVTDLDLFVEATFGAKTEMEGVVCVPAQVFSNTISNLKEEVISLESKNDNLTIKTKTSTTNIKAVPHNDFPTMPELKNKKEEVSIPTKSFLQGVGSVWYSTGNLSIKPELSSVYMYKKDEALVFVATDSFRLAEKTVSLEKQNEDFGVLIPIKNVANTIKIVEKSDDKNLTIEIGQGRLILKTENIYLITRINEGNFPDYKQLIPKEFICEAILLKQDVIDALRLTSTFSDKFFKASLNIKPAKGLFEIETNNPDYGHSTNKLEAALSGEGIDINLNYRYILDSLSSITTDSIKLSFSGDNKPIVISPVGDKSFVYIVMPTRK
jgi:DNA polymerase-3 subunit beta